MTDRKKTVTRCHINEVSGAPVEIDLSAEQAVKTLTVKRLDSEEVEQCWPHT